MTEPERIDGRIRDLAELCTRHGTPCADGLLAEIGRLRTDLDHARAEWSRHNKRADMWRNEDRITRQALWAELERTEGDLGVAIREAAAAREALRKARDWVAVAACTNVGEYAAKLDTLRIVDAALAQRLAPDDAK